MSQQKVQETGVSREMVHRVADPSTRDGT